MTWERLKFQEQIKIARRLNREELLEWIGEGRGDCLRREIGRIVIAELDQTDALTLHREEMEKNREMHRQTQTLAAIAVIVSVVVALPDVLDYFGLKPKIGTQLEQSTARPTTVESISTAVSTKGDVVEPVDKEPRQELKAPPVEPPKAKGE